MISLHEARKILNNKVPTKRVKHRNGYFYTSPLGYVCYKSSYNTKECGVAICTDKQFENPSYIQPSTDPVYLAASVVIATLNQWGQPTAASLFDLEQALINANY